MASLADKFLSGFHIKWIFLPEIHTWDHFLNIDVIGFAHNDEII